MSQCQWKKLASHTFLRYVQPEILTNIFGAFTNEHPVVQLEKEDFKLAFWALCVSVCVMSSALTVNILDTAYSILSYLPFLGHPKCSYGLSMDTAKL